VFSSYGFGFEKRNLHVETLNLSITRFPGKLRIVHLSDIHFNSHTRFMDNVIVTSNKLKPDQIYITGDLVEKNDYLNACLEWLANFTCKHIYFSPGNWEHWAGTLKNGLVEKLNELGITTLINSGLEVEIGNKAFYLAGIDDAYFGFPNALKAFENNKNNLPSLVLSHSPVGINIVRPLRPSLVFSGHTHGGQICFPGLGAIKTPPGSGVYEQGLYSLDNINMYVNRGIGTSIIPLRFFCPPEITLYDIEGI
jgi:predicted MPP superfamily phosphohydrolase